jgi:hypothetical protein
MLAQEPMELTDRQKGILEVFDKILQLSMNLFQIDDMKMKSIICGQFTSYQELLFRMNTDRFNPQFEMMISLSIQHLKYPEWFDITKKTTENEDEETFLELREDLIRFLEPLI